MYIDVYINIYKYTHTWESNRIFVCSVTFFIFRFFGFSSAFFLLDLIYVPTWWGTPLSPPKGHVCNPNKNTWLFPSFRCWKKRLKRIRWWDQDFSKTLDFLRFAIIFSEEDVWNMCEVYERLVARGMILLKVSNELAPFLGFKMKRTKPYRYNSFPPRVVKGTNQCRKLNQFWLVGFRG